MSIDITEPERSGREIDPEEVDASLSFWGWWGVFLLVIVPFGGLVVAGVWVYLIAPNPHVPPLWCKVFFYLGPGLPVGWWLLHRAMARVRVRKALISGACPACEARLDLHAADRYGFVTCVACRAKWRIGGGAPSRP